jgi:hypothetical protein
MKSNNITMAGMETGGTGSSKKSSLRILILFLLIALCALFYYFGELVDWAAWDILRANFFYGVHDIHRLLFLAPILYAAHVFGIRATIIVTIIAMMTFLPRALFISPYPDPLLRMVLFTVIAGTVGYLVALVRKKSRRCEYLESLLEEKKNDSAEGNQPVAR